MLALNKITNICPSCGQPAIDSILFNTLKKPKPCITV